MKEHSDVELISNLIGGQAAKLPMSLSLADLSGRTASELTKEFQLTIKAATVLVSAVELGRRSSLTTIRRGAAFRGSADVFNHFHLRLRDLKVEQFHVILVDGKHRLIREVLVSQGTLTSSPVHPREVFAAAVRNHAAGIVLVHNHPSGDPSPSVDDIEITKRLQTAGEMIGIRIIDHVIVGDGSFASFADKGLL